MSITLRGPVTLETLQTKLAAFRVLFDREAKVTIQGTFTCRATREPVWLNGYAGKVTVVVGQWGYLAVDLGMGMSACCDPSAEDKIHLFLD